MQASKTSTTPTENIGQAVGWNFDNSYTTLPGIFYATINPTPVKEPQLVIFNTNLAGELGLNFGSSSNDELAAIFSGNEIPEGANPLAQAYAGHQFGHFTMLGDGRAILLGEQLTRDGVRYDIQFKGSGQTPFSRRGDGRAALGPMLREYIISEAMHALGIPTTRSLAVVTTGESVYRENILPGAILTRVAQSHIRVGTFEFAAAQGDLTVLKALADYTIHRHYPEALNAENIYLAFFKIVAESQARLIAAWQLAGFIHGVMNTDNMSLAGESIDFGPCAFMDAYHPATVFSSIDQHGRYAYANQPRIASWNLARFAEALLPLIHENDEQAMQLGQEALSEFGKSFNHHWLTGMRAKLGIVSEEENDIDLITSLLALMEKHAADYTNTFRALGAESLPHEPLYDDVDFMSWKKLWYERLARQSISQNQALETMRSVNPVVIPRNHRVEEALAAAESGDLTVMQNLLQVLSKPFAESSENHAYRNPAAMSGEPYKTFCGT